MNELSRREKEFKNYDMRRFTIKDVKDLLAFIDMVDNMLPKARSAIKSLQQREVAKTNIIHHLEKKNASLSSNSHVATSPSEAKSVIQSLPQSVDFDKKEYLDKMRQSRDNILDDARKKAAIREEAKEKAKRDSEPKEKIIEPKKGYVSIGGYSIRRFKTGQFRYYHTEGPNSGRLASSTEVPEGVKEELIAEYKKMYPLETEKVERAS